MTKGPVLFDLEQKATLPNVADAAPVPEATTQLPHGNAMQAAAQLAARKPSRLTRVFWWLAAGLLGAVVSISAWQFVTDLMGRFPVLGLTLTALIGVFLFVLALISLREVAAFGRLSRLDSLRHAAAAALTEADLTAARGVCTKLNSLYRGREDTRWGRDRFAELAPDQLDAVGLLQVAEAEMLGPLDQAALGEVVAASRQVATITALVPLALVDVVGALTANLRMIRRIAEIYGGRSGFFGSWRLTRAVLSHLVATGAVAVGDDLLEPFLGGTVLGKLSRRFGEGVVNGALTARVGIAAMEVCRPLPFSPGKKPKTRQVIKRALTTLFARENRG